MFGIVLLSSFVVFVARVVDVVPMAEVLVATFVVSFIVPSLDFITVVEDSVQLENIIKVD